MKYVAGGYVDGSENKRQRHTFNCHSISQTGWDPPPTKEPPTTSHNAWRALCILFGCVGASWTSKTTIYNYCCHLLTSWVHRIWIWCQFRSASLDGFLLKTNDLIHDLIIAGLLGGCQLQFSFHPQIVPIKGFQLRYLGFYFYSLLLMNFRHEMRVRLIFKKSVVFSWIRYKVAN